MNIIYLRYALEVARTGSVSKAAKNLFIAQPNLSRAIRELESSLRITIFERKNNGVTITPEGERFLRYGQRIIREIDEMEVLFGEGQTKKRSFSVSVPHSAYISAAFAAFTKDLEKEPACELFYEETDTMRTVDNLLHAGYKLGIIRYDVAHDSYFKSMLDEKRLNYELVAEFDAQLIINQQSPLAKQEIIRPEDLASYIELVHADPFVPSAAEEPGTEMTEADDRRKIYVYERASQMDLLASNPETYLWGAPTPVKLLEQYGLTVRACADRGKKYKDVLLYRMDYTLTALDKQFITALCNSRRATFAS